MFHVVCSGPLYATHTKEHLNAQGVPMWPELCGGDPFPVFAAALPPTVTKRIAGNVTWQHVSSIQSLTPIPTSHIDPGHSHSNFFP